jgi:uncharacterized protein (DUF1697 family)
MRCLAFLRAINARGQTVSMEYLRTIFEAEGFTRVETFLEGGNVIFEGDAEDPAGLERVIEQMLADALGYDVATFLRTDAEVRNISKYTPFMPAFIKAAAALNVALFKEPLDEKQARAVMALKTKNDSFHVHGRGVLAVADRSWPSRSFRTRSSKSPSAVRPRCAASTPFVSSPSDMAPGSRGVAFLRAINVGGSHVVKMDRLKKLFEHAGFTGVDTYIASGNVVFDLSPSAKGATVERAIEAMLLDALGYEVATFVRTGRELRAAAEHEPFARRRSKRRFDSTSHS